jgi:hypothetical protein
MYASQNIIRVIKLWGIGWLGYVASMREMRNGYKVFIEISEGNRPIGRSRRRREDNIRIDVREIG